MGKSSENDELSNYVSIRLDDQMAADIDVIREKERRSTRSDTIRALIGEALDARKPVKRQLATAK